LSIAKTRIVELNRILTGASIAYYIDLQPIMSDAQFDLYEKELKLLVAENPAFASLAPVLNKPGSDLTKNGGRVPHRVPMLSIENMYTEEDFLAQFDKWGGVPVVLEPKFDGISVSLRYSGGNLLQALTRGDGASGEDMTAQVCATTIPRVLYKPIDVEIRGELVMKNSTLEHLNKKFAANGQKTYSSTRNLTAGTMKLKDVALIPERKIVIRVWDVIGKDLPNSRLERLQLIAKDGFEKPQSILVTDRNQVIPTLHKLLEQNKTSDINADGVVMKVNDVPTCERLGISSKYTNYQTCFKPQSDKAETYLRRVVWQIGRTGRLTPVAECNPVNLAGAIVTRANINNVTWIKEMGLTIGAKIEMLRSGGVIPKIEQVIDPTGTPIVAPTECPECSGKLTNDTDETSGVLQIFCTNEFCRGRVIGHFCFVGDREVLEIDGLGPEMADLLVKNNYANNLGELMLFGNDIQEQISLHGEAPVAKNLSRYGFSVTVISLVKSLEKAKTASWDRWIAALGIPMISDSLGKIIAREMKLLPDDMKNLHPALRTFVKREVAGMGPSKKQAILDWLSRASNIEMLYTLYDAGVRPTPLASAAVAAGAPLVGTAFCITGEFGESRDIITSKLVSLGATSKSSVTKNCNLLIVGSVPGASKTKAAAALGTKTVDEAWLRETLEKNGLTLAKPKFIVEES
jgi:DNA ligase (NAD+)